jgi:hypothetical protein
MKSANALNGGPRKQQTIERRYFEMFLKAYPLPSGTITHGDKPDVILAGAQNIGIEITNFYLAKGKSPNSEQVQRRRRAAAVAKGHHLYRKDGGENIELAFGFDPWHPIQDADKLAAQIADLARRVEGRDNGKISKDVFEEIPQLGFAYLLARELQYSAEPDPQFPNGQPDPSEGAAYKEYRNRRQTRALREGIYKPLPWPAKWKVTQAHDIGLMSTERLMEIIREKEVKARSYSTCDAYWLLIVVDFMDLAQDQEIRIDDLSVTSDVFEKIIIYKTYLEHIVEITPQPVRQTSAGR